MALSKCKECNKEVSSEAKACPHCGVSSPVPKKGGCLALIVLAGVITFLISRCGEDEAKEKKQACDAGDKACISEKYKREAWNLCKPIIERSAKFDYEFTDNWLDGGFTRYVVQDDQTIRYYGDKVKFANGFNAKTPMTYLCHYDIKAKKITDFSISQGRIN